MQVLELNIKDYVNNFFCIELDLCLYRLYYGKTVLEYVYNLYNGELNLFREETCNICFHSVCDKCICMNN